MTQETARRRCLNPGCPCKDARIVSTRRAGLVKFLHPEATPVRTGLTPLPADWPAKAYA